MSTNKEYMSFILDQLSGLDGITYRQMMGEYIIYYHGRIAAYICDDRLLVKPVKAAENYLKTLVYEPPYPGAKDMLLVDDADNAEYLTRLFEAMYDELPEPAAKKRKRN